jgi:hypothetical protein
MKRKPVSASTLQMAMVYSGLVVATVNPFAGAITAGILYKLYKTRKSVEDAEQTAHQAAARQEFKAKFYRRQQFPSYKEYLASPQWHAKRQIVVQRASGRCEKPDCTHSLEEVHHLYYPRIWGSEAINSLVGLCEVHHRQEHGIGEYGGRAEG